MKIQFVSLKKDNIQGKYDYTCSTLNTPSSLDVFDVNIFSLQDFNLWRYDENDHKKLDQINDFKSIRTMIENSSKSINIIALPQNYTHMYCFYSGRYNKTVEIKDEINNLKFNILSEIIPSDYFYDLIYENSKTKLSNSVFDAAFGFTAFEQSLTISDGNKATTIRSGNLILTTLDLKSSQTTIDDFIDGIGLGDKKIEIPQWLVEYECFDDKQQKDFIAENELKIEKLKIAINESKERLNENEKYKSILISNNDTLVCVVFEMLQKMLKCDLSNFVDEKKEDFVVKKENITFVGEIKGINSNIKYNNVSQAERHRAEYLDVLDSEKRNENVKALLIINPLRKTPIKDREAVNQAQIDYAINNNVLIITTETFLRLFEKFLIGKLSSDDVIKIFTEKVGLLGLNNF